MRMHAASDQQKPAILKPKLRKTQPLWPGESDCTAGRFGESVHATIVQSLQARGSPGSSTSSGVGPGLQPRGWRMSLTLHGCLRHLPAGAALSATELF